jgi:ABC-2 type transport system ATP-binding protein
MADSPAVEVVGLVKRYNGRSAVDGLDLSAALGAVTAVLGPNGAGKTSTIEICEGLRRPDGGSVRVLGLDPVADARALRPRVGVMLQSGGVYTAVRPLEMLRHVAGLHAHPLDVDELAERLGLGEHAKTPYKRLSGGQQQRLGLALAVVGRPDLVFLDEPTAGLDPQARRASWELVEELRSSGVTVVLSTHNMDEAQRLADHVVVVDHGRVVAEGSPQALTADTAGRRLTFRLATAVEPTTLAAAVGPTVVVASSEPGCYEVTGAITPQVLADLTAWCAAQSLMPEGLTLERRSLEDVFLELTGYEVRA